MEDYSKYLSRKFLISLLIIILSSIFVYLKVIDPTIWCTVTIANITSYHVVNVWQGKT